MRAVQGSMKPHRATDSWAVRSIAEESTRVIPCKAMRENGGGGRSRTNLAVDNTQVIANIFLVPVNFVDSKIVGRIGAP